MSELLVHLDDQQLKKWFADHPNAVLNQDYVLIDIRELNEYQSQHIPNSIHLPMSQLPKEPKADKQLTAFVYCAAGGRSRMASSIILSWGFAETFGLEGGMQQWLRCQTESS